jgi:poly(beta-D-mannuronate) lyase
MKTTGQRHSLEGLYTGLLCTILSVAVAPLCSAQTEITPGAGSITASTNDGNVPGNTVDNNLGTRWSANGDGQWIRYDLGSSRTVALVKIAFYSGNVRTTTFDLQTSNDGSAWTNVLTNVSSSGTTTQEQTFDFADVSARYVRYLGHGNSVNLWNSLAEVSIFAPGSTATPTPTPGGSVNINWSPWTLQLPNNTQVSPGSTNNQWFYPSGSFQAFADPVTGICTSGSSHCRSELRETSTWGSGGTNVLNATVKVTKGSGSITIGQVFCNSGTNGAHTQVELFYRSSGFSILYEEQKGAGSTTSVGNAVPLGTTFTYQLSFIGGKMAVKINGATVWTKTPSSAAQSGAFYFKAGNYDQSSSCGTLSSTINSIVQFSNISVSH